VITFRIRIAIVVHLKYDAMVYQIIVSHLKEIIKIKVDAKLNA
jgi:hypothetical protein